MRMGASYVYTMQFLPAFLVAVAVMSLTMVSAQTDTTESHKEQTTVPETLGAEYMVETKKIANVTDNASQFDGEFSPDYDETQTHDTCQPCPCVGTTMDCSTSHIRAFYMKNTAAKITKLDLAHNVLEELPSSVFSGLPHLQSILVSDNYIAAVERNAFQGLDTLQTLDMSGNAITSLPATVLSNHWRLRRLYMGRNRLNDITFLTHIRNCSLELVQFTTNALAWLSVQTFGSCTALKEIWLDDNKIAQIDEDAFDGLVFLNTLDLSSNRLTEIPSTAFHSLTALKVLDLSRNQLVTIDGGLFETLTSLRSLYLSFNWLRTVPAEAFSYCVSLRRLSLSDNLIEFIDEDAFTSSPQQDLPPKRVIHPKCAILTNRTANVAVKYLDLSHNHLRKIPAASFMAFTNIEELNLNFNLITTFDTDVICLAGILQDRLHFTGNRLVCTCGTLYDAFRLSEKIAPDFQPECLHSGEPWVILKSRRCREKTSSVRSEGMMARMMMPGPLPPSPQPKDNGLHAAIVAPILAVAFISSLAAMGVSMFRRYRRVRFDVSQTDTVQMTRYSRAPTFSSSTITNSTDVSRL